MYKYKFNDLFKSNTLRKFLIKKLYICLFYCSVHDIIKFNKFQVSDILTETTHWNLY